MAEDVPAVLQNTANLAFVAQLLAWQEGDPAPHPPPTLAIPLPEFIALLNDPDNRAYVVRRLSVLLQGKTVASAKRPANFDDLARRAGRRQRATERVTRLPAE